MTALEICAVAAILGILAGAIVGLGLWFFWGGFDL